MTASSPPPLSKDQQPAETTINVSRGFAGWLASNAVSLAFTSYQTGQLFLVGMLPNGQVSFNKQNFQRAMGLHYTPGRLYLGSLFQLWRLENMLKPGERGNQAFDSVLVPRNAQTLGDIDVHEVAVDRAGRVVFVNTKYSCLATPSLTHSFKPVWKPPFISRLAPEDRCHLNGLAMEDGAPAYVTAVSRSDIVNGWRERRQSGGVLMDVRDDRIVTDQLSMPHSPRVWEDALWVLDSGRGFLVRVDPVTGAREDIAFCPGFLRGLSFHNGHAIVTVSLPRHGAFNDLALQQGLEQRDADPWCGVLIINVRTGAIVEWLRLGGDVSELFDVAAMAGVQCPMSIGPASLEIQTTITLEA